MTVLAPAAPRLAIAYGSFALSAANGIVLDSEYDHRDTPTDGLFSVTFRVQLLAPTGVVATDDAAFAALVAAVDTNLRLPRQTLTATLGSAPLLNWSWAGNPQTAVLISPELELLEDNARDFCYRFRVRAQFPGNVPGNTFRRDSLTRVGTSLRENRQCEITATWTSSTGTSAYSRYTSSGDAFFNAFLPANSVDQYGTTGTWVRANEDPTFNDENSVITATRLYWEVFAGRRDSRAVSESTIAGRRVFRLPSTWTQSPGFTALQNYNDGIAGFVAHALPAPVGGGEWVLVDEVFGYNDQNGELTSERTYQECVAGLREYSVEVTTGPAGERALVLSGVYYDTTATFGGATAKANYTAGINGLIAAVVAAETPSISHSESTSVPAVTRYDTTGLRYFFRRTIRELVYPENGTSSPTWDDSDVRFERLTVKVNKPHLAQSITSANPVTQLQTAAAPFDCFLNMQNVTNPAATWAASLRAHVVYAISNKLGVDVGAVVLVVSEDVSVELDKNRIRGELVLVVANAIGGGALGILELRLMQKINQRPGRIYVERADGTNYSYFPYRKGPRKTLHRSGMVKYIAGTGPPVLFGVGDLASVSGFTGMVDTGITAQASIDAQNAAGTLNLATLAPSGWIVDPEAPEPYSYTDEPVTLGDGSGLNVVTHVEGDDWFFAAALEPGTTIIP